MADAPTRPAKKTITPGAWQEARALVYAHRGRLGLGLALLLVNRLAGLVLPSSSKWVIDRVINQHHPELLLPLALAAGGATLVQAVTGFALSQVLGVAAQRAITDMPLTVQAYVLRLPISYFDSTKSGILISRIMNDAEGIRNLVGTGLVQLVGGLVTAALALGVLFYLNWRLTLIAILILACFGGGMAYAFTKLRPLFRDRAKLNAEVTGRLGETLGGIRIVKAYRAERSERLVFTRGANTLFRNIATTMTGISAVGAFATIIIGAIGILMILEGGEEHADQSRAHLQSPEIRAHLRGRSRSRHPAARRLSPPARRRPPGQLLVRRHDRGEHRVRPAARDPRRYRGGGAHRPLR